MPKFEFQLEGVLAHRRTVERQRQRDLAVVQGQMRQLEDELRGLDQAVKEATADLRQNRLVGAIDLAFLAAHRRFTLSMQRKGLALVQKMAILQRQVDEKRQALAEAAKARKVIEKLRERHHQRWQAAMDKRELEQLDEISMRLSYSNIHQQSVAEDGGAM